MNTEQNTQLDDVIDFSDGMSAELPKNAKGTALRLFRQLANQKVRLILVLGSVLISCALTMTAPLVIGQAINGLYDSLKNTVTNGAAFASDLGSLGITVLLLLGLYLLTTGFSYLQQRSMASVSQTLTLSLRKEINHKLGKLPLKYFDFHKKGDVLSRITNDLEKVADTLQDGFMQFATATVNIIGAVLLMLIISPLLTLIALTTVVLSILLTGYFSKKSQHYFTENQKVLGELNGQIEELFTGQLVIKAFHREQDAIGTVKEVSDRLYDAGKKAQFISYAVTPAIRLVNQIGYVVIAVLGGIFVAQGKLSLGIVQAFFQYVNQASEPLTEAAYIVNMMQAAIASAERVFELLDEEEEIPEPEKPQTLSNPRGAVSFHHVRFGYRDDTILMQDINLNLSPGAKIAIVGPTGAGKTTLINLLMRFYEPQGGHISIDGVDLRDMTRSSLRSLFGMVLQDTWLFGGTVEENIAYSCETATKEKIRQAAKAAHADHFIRTLPDGYQTKLNEEGTNISQGQRQLLTIARALLANPPMLILDEATSSVDTRTELSIQKAMNHLMQGRTSFVIAHRLSTIRDADHILVMKDGTIIEQGNHDALLQQHGFYEKLYNSQFAAKATA